MFRLFLFYKKHLGFEDTVLMEDQPSKDDIEYALDNTHVLRAPDRRIDTFGNTKFKFVILSEMMDSVGKVKIRRGEVEAHKPQIIKPAHYNSIELDGFDERGEEFLEWLKKNGLEPVFFKYGFNFKRIQGHEEVVSDSIETVKERVLEAAYEQDDPMLAVVEAVESSWQIGLLKFSVDMIEKSQEINEFDYKRKGLI